MVDDRMTADLALWLIAATDQEIHEFGHRECPRCDVCGRVVAAADCEADATMCWHQVHGFDRRCDLLRNHARAVAS